MTTSEARRKALEDIAYAFSTEEVDRILRRLIQTVLAQGTPTRKRSTKSKR